MFILFFVIMVTLVVASLITYLLTKYFSQKKTIVNSKVDLVVDQEIISPSNKKLLKRGHQIQKSQVEDKSSVSKHFKHEQAVPAAITDSFKAFSGVVKKEKKKSKLSTNSSLTVTALSNHLEQNSYETDQRLAESSEKKIHELRCSVENLQKSLNEENSCNQILQQSCIKLTSQVELLTEKCNKFMMQNRDLEDTQNEQAKKCALLTEQLQKCAMQFDCENILEESLLNRWSCNGKSSATVCKGSSPYLSLEEQIHNLTNLFSACNDKLKEARRELEMLQQASQTWHNLEDKLNIDLRHLENELALERQHSASVLGVKEQCHTAELRTIMDEKKILMIKLQETCQCLDQLKNDALQVENKQLHFTLSSTSEPMVQEQQQVATTCRECATEKQFEILAYSLESTSIKNSGTQGGTPQGRGQTQLDVPLQERTKPNDDVEESLELLAGQVVEAQRVAEEQAEVYRVAQEELARLRGCLRDTDDSLRRLLSMSNEEHVQWEERLSAVSAERDAARDEVQRLLAEKALDLSLLGDCSFFSAAIESTDLEEMRRCVAKEKKQAEELRKALGVAQDTLQQERDLVAKLQDQINQQQQPATQKRKRSRLSVLLRALNCSCATKANQDIQVDSNAAPFAARSRDCNAS